MQAAKYIYVYIMYIYIYTAYGNYPPVPCGPPGCEGCCMSDKTLCVLIANAIVYCVGFIADYLVSYDIRYKSNVIFLTPTLDRSCMPRLALWQPGSQQISIPACTGDPHWSLWHSRPSQSNPNRTKYQGMTMHPKWKP